MSTVLQHIKKGTFFLLTLSMVAGAAAFIAPSTADACVYQDGDLYVEYYPGSQNPSTGESSSGGGWAQQGDGFIRVVSTEYAQSQEVCDGEIGGGGGGFSIVDISANPMIITQGNSSVLSWTSDSMVSCSIDQGIGSVEPNVPGSQTVTPAATITYTINCTGEDGMFHEDAVTVTVNAPPPPVATLSVSPETATSGSSAMLTYRCQNSTSGSISPSVGAVTADGASHSVSTGALTKSQQFTLTCTGASGTAQAYATVNVLSVQLTADPGSIVLGNATTLTWTSTYAETCTSPDFNTLGDTEGTIAVSPSATTTYTVNCSRSGTASSGTWVNDPSRTDMSDLTCPISSLAINRVYGGVPTCPSTAASGGACTGSSVCKINTAINANGSSGCFVETKMYYCSGSGTTPPATVSDSVTVGVTTQGQGVDLIAGEITPKEVGADTPTTFYVSVVNQGTDTTGRGFPVLFQRAATPGGGSSSDQGYTDVPFELEGGAQQGVESPDITLPLGTWYLRACADKNARLDPGVVTESNETNNCGPWTQIDVVDPESCPGCGDDKDYVVCLVSDDRVTPGTTVTYTAEPHGDATAPYTWTAPDGEVGFGNAITTTRTFTQVGSYNMELRATNATKAANCPVVVVGLCPGTPVVNLTADQARVNSGESTTLRWNQITSVSKSCKVVRESDGAVLYTAVADSCTVPAGSVPSGAITTQTTFNMVCDEVVRDTVIVNVPVNVVEF